MPDFAENLRRLMARAGLTIEGLAERAGVDPRTVKGILRGDRPHARTLHRLAQGLGVESDELFEPSAAAARRRFDRATNGVVDEALAGCPEMCADWTEADFDELYSRFGAGGALTADGALETVRAMNRNRETHEKVAVLLETAEAEMLRQIVDALYRRVAVPH
jgi:transcriptional regulator with XRE-family HTH domain